MEGIDEDTNLEATFNELTKFYNKILAEYGHIELAYFYDDVDTVSNYLTKMSRLNKMLYKKWETIESKDLKEDLSIMSAKLGDLIVISEKKWISQSEHSSLK